MEKMTNVKALAYVLAHADLPSDVKEKVEKMKAQFEKKNSAEKKPTATQIANEGIKGVILETLGNGSLTITEIQKAMGLETNQKTSALVRQLRLAHLVVRTEEKGKAYFTKA